MEISIGVSLAVGLAALVAIRGAIRGTTLLAPWWWSVMALVTACGTELLLALGGAGESDSAAAAIRYAARTLLLAPTVSLIGAMRPQAGAWNFVVASLWAVLALPSAEALLLNTGQPLEIQSFRSWFLLGLIFVTLACTLPTKHWSAAFCVTLGQAFALHEYLPYSLPASPLRLALSGLALMVAAAIVFTLSPPRSTAATSLDRLWLDFRDSFGLFWGLRVQERMNAAAKMYDWPLTLRWTGWITADGRPLTEELPDDQRRAVLTTFRGLLRRFVSNEWMERRIG